MTDRFEERLRRVEWPPPPDDLRRRVLAAVAADRPVEPVRALAAAAVLLIAVATLLNTWVDDRLALPPFARRPAVRPADELTDVEAPTGLLVRTRPAPRRTPLRSFPIGGNDPT